MQASQHDAFAAERFTLPKAMRIRSATPANRITLAPRLFEIAKKHIHHPPSCAATIRIRPAGFCTLKYIQSFT
jgi:hypothetical protein